MKEKNLKSYLQHLAPLGPHCEKFTDFTVRNLSSDSRKISEDSIFVAVKGSLADGHDFIKEAVSKGAKAIVCTRIPDFEMPGGLNVIRVADSYRAYAMLSELFFDFPARSMRLCGITGTNGKTTCAFLLRKIIEDAGEKCGLISTVEYSRPGKTLEAQRTTPESFELQSLFSEMKKSGCKYVVMEVSSHGLEQYRTGDSPFETAIFTNLSGDHLDFHKNMEAYFNAKKRLFLEHLAQDGNAVVNTDDAFGKKLYSELKNAGYRTISYGRGDGSICRIIESESSAGGSRIRLSMQDGTVNIRSSLTGDYNAYNIAAAAAAAQTLEISTENIIRSLNRDISVPGRLEHFRSPAGADIYMDYAHTDDALKNVLSTLRKICSGKLVTVFGCGGNRDRTKRPRMGKAAAEYSDTIILTSDNPRDENPDDIISEIASGIPAGTEFIRISDRRSAIRKAVDSASEGDFVLVAGKGHEAKQEVKGRFFEFSDRSEIIKAFKKLKTKEISRPNKTLTKP